MHQTYHGFFFFLGFKSSVTSAIKILTLSKYISKDKELFYVTCNVSNFCVCVQGHSVNVLTIDHVTPLHEACVGDHVACARALIDAGANVRHSFRTENVIVEKHSPSTASRLFTSARLI